eukprot:tig00000572_g2210.t1
MPLSGPAVARGATRNAASAVLTGFVPATGPVCAVGPKRFVRTAYGSIAKAQFGPTVWASGGTHLQWTRPARAPRHKPRGIDLFAILQNAGVAPPLIPPAAPVASEPAAAEAAKAEGPAGDDAGAKEKLGDARTSGSGGKQKDGDGAGSKKSKVKKEKDGKEQSGGADLKSKKKRDSEESGAGGKSKLKKEEKESAKKSKKEKKKTDKHKKEESEEEEEGGASSKKRGKKHKAKEASSGSEGEEEEEEEKPAKGKKKKEKEKKRKEGEDAEKPNKKKKGKKSKEGGEKEEGSEAGSGGESEQEAPKAAPKKKKGKNKGGDKAPGSEGEASGSGAEDEGKPPKKKAKKKDKGKKKEGEDEKAEDGSGKEEDGFVDEVICDADATNDDLCHVCAGEGELLMCEGACQRSFHLACLGMKRMPSGKRAWVCLDCTCNRHSCFVCEEYGDDGRDVLLCQHAPCGKYYHLECLKRVAPDPGAVESVAPQKKATRFGARIAGCPRHRCAACAKETAPEDPRCFRCPKAYHKGCVPPEEEFPTVFGREHLCVQCAGSPEGPASGEEAEAEAKPEAGAGGEKSKKKKDEKPKKEKRKTRDEGAGAEEPARETAPEKEARRRAGEEDGGPGPAHKRPKTDEHAARTPALGAADASPPPLPPAPPLPQPSPAPPGPGQPSASPKSAERRAADERDRKIADERERRAGEERERRAAERKAAEEARDERHFAPSAGAPPALQRLQRELYAILIETRRKGFSKLPAAMKEGGKFGPEEYFRAEWLRAVAQRIPPNDAAFGEACGPLAKRRVHLVGGDFLKVVRAFRDLNAEELAKLEDSGPKHDTIVKNGPDGSKIYLCGVPIQMGAVKEPCEKKVSRIGQLCATHAAKAAAAASKTRCAYPVPAKRESEDASAPAPMVPCGRLVVGGGKRCKEHAGAPRPARPAAARPRGPRRRPGASSSSTAAEKERLERRDLAAKIFAKRGPLLKKSPRLAPPPPPHRRSDLDQARRPAPPPGLLPDPNISFSSSPL